ncbi:MAG: GntR family transcriptional regulator [Clostridia bacterium]|nr:GntR family transcriptional regulator [Clostridia bacterium]
MYEQIEEQVIWLINSGVYEPGSKLPSLRTLSSELKLNINTVKRAFQELEAKGIVYSAQGKGVFVSQINKANETLKAEAIENLRTSVRSARAKGVTQREIQSVVDEIYCLKQVK